MPVIEQNKVQQELPSRPIIDTWRESDVGAIFRLEELAWAPWLRKPPEQIRHIAQHYPEINLIGRTTAGLAIGTLSANRIDWDDDPNSLTSWNDIAGGSVQEGNYEPRHSSTGNTLVLMSSSVD